MIFNTQIIQSGGVGLEWIAPYYTEANEYMFYLQHRTPNPGDIIVVTSPDGLLCGICVREGGFINGWKSLTTVSGTLSITITTQTSGPDIVTAKTNDDQTTVSTLRMAYINAPEA